MSTIAAYHLPGLDPGGLDGWDERAAGPPWPQLHAIGRRLRAAQQRLQHRPVDDIVAVVDAAAARLLDPHDPLRRLAEEALPPLTGYSAPMVRLVLDAMAADWRRPALLRLLEAELGGPAVLDAPVAERGRTRMAVPYPVVLHVFAGNIPGVAVTSLVRALLVRAASLGKTAYGEPLLPALFAQAVASVDAGIGDALAIGHWRGGDAALEDVAFRESDAIVVYGGEGALAAVRRRAPALTPVLDHGPRLSVGFITRAAIPDPEAARLLAADVARAVATFDQQGCVSPHAVYIEEGAAGGDAFPALLVDALHALEAELPRGPLTPEEAAAIRAVRTHAEFAGFAGRASSLVSPPDAPFTVILHDGATFEPSCLQRTIHLHRVASLDDGLHALHAHRALLQTAAVAGADTALLRRFAQSGFTRVTSFARMAWPDPASHHDGRGPLTELLRFSVVEDA